jgi:hypothetical protein
MAKKAKDDFAPDQLAQIAIDAINQAATSTKAYSMGDHAEHTWGIPIPSLAFQWVIGGCSVFPCQRYLSVSGEPKSFKSTLMIEILTWYILAGGLGTAIDNESKSSASMLSAMTWWRLTEAQSKLLIFKESASVEEWQSIATAAIQLARRIGYRDKGARIPSFVSIDSLTGKASEGDQERIEKEGMAQARGYPTTAAQITRYLEAMQLHGTTCSVGYVRHLKQAIEQTGGYGPPPKRETGGAAANFKASLSLRVTKCAGFEKATHEAMPHPGVPCTGHPLIIESNMSCLGPDHRKLWVDLIWQYVDSPHPDDPTLKGPRRQIMKYDWEGALGYLLWQMKYDKKFGNFAYDIARLDDALYFVQNDPNHIKCEALGLDGASFTAFGRAIEQNPEMRQKVSNFLDIIQYSNIQEVDLTDQTVLGD